MRDTDGVTMPPPEPRREELTAALRAELVNLWADFEHASRESLAPGAAWSMGQEWFLERIKTLSDLVGPASWRDVSIPFLLSETYRAACERIGYPVAASDAELAGVRERWSAEVAGWRC